MTSVRRDYYQIPYDPNPNDIENGSIPANGFSPQYPSIGLRDGQTEADAGVLITWLRTFNSHLLTTVSPFYHYNSGDYASNPNDVPIATTENRASTYVGGQATLAANFKKNDLQVGFLSFHQSDSQRFGAIFNDGSGNLPFTISESPTANLEAFYIDDKFKPFSWLMLSAGMRPTRFAEGNFSSVPRAPSLRVRHQPTLGRHRHHSSHSLDLPRLLWSLLSSAAHRNRFWSAGSPLCQPAKSCGFLPLHGERDEEHQFGVTIPYRGWVLDADNFKTDVANFLDHNNVGESNIFFPSPSPSLIRGWELTLRSPRIAHRLQLHLAYSNQIAEGSGDITGGLNNVQPSPGLSPLDHDQRNTLNVGGDLTFPGAAYASTNVYYGSGFSNAFPGQPYSGNYLPSHTTFDLSSGKDFGERFTASLTALNVTNHRVEYDNSLTYGGFHWNLPRQIYVQVRYRFHY